MLTFFRTAVHFTNVPLLERLVRAAAGLGLAAAPFFFETSPLLRGLSVASGLGFAATGFIGFCPACYLVGRRLDARRPE
jgi:hypothetical protein